MSEEREKAFEYFAEQLPKYGVRAEIIRVDMPRFRVLQRPAHVRSDDAATMGMFYDVVMPDYPDSVEAVVQTLTIDGFKPEGETQPILRIFENNPAAFYDAWFQKFAETVKYQNQVFMYSPPQLGRGKLFMIDPLQYYTRVDDARLNPTMIPLESIKIFSMNDVNEVEIASVYGRFWTSGMMTPDTNALLALKSILG